MFPLWDNNVLFQLLMLQSFHGPLLGELWYFLRQRFSVLFKFLDYPVPKLDCSLMFLP